MAANPNPEDPPAGEELVTFAEAGRRLGIALRTVQDWAASGKLPVYEISPHRRYVIWSAISAELRSIARAHRADHPQPERRSGGPGATMRRSRPDATGGAEPDEPAGTI